MWQKLNNLYLGLFVGVLIPAVIYFIIIHPKMRIYSGLEGYYKQIVMDALPLFLTRCIFPNALLFFLLIWRNILLTAKGVLISTAVLTGILVIINFIL